MKPSTKIHIILFSCLAILMAACVKEVQYPVEPEIKFGDFGTYRDFNGKDSLGVLSISYTDGDGDIGLYDSDTAEPYKYNYFLKFQQFHNGQLTEVKPADTASTNNYRIPLLTPNGRNKNIRGIIKMTLELYYVRAVLLSDTIAFQVYIKDRALHTSNVVQTPMFIIHK